MWAVRLNLIVCETMQIQNTFVFRHIIEQAFVSGANELNTIPRILCASWLSIDRILRVFSFSMLPNSKDIKLAEGRAPIKRLRWSHVVSVASVKSRAPKRKTSLEMSLMVTMSVRVAIKLILWALRAFNICSRLRSPCVWFENFELQVIQMLVYWTFMAPLRDALTSLKKKTRVRQSLV